jgi:cell division septation protein DedD
MNATGDARERSKGPRSDTIELLGSLFKAPDKSKIKLVRAKARPESAANRAAISKHIKDGQQRMSVDRLMRQMRPSSPRIDIGEIKEKNQARKRIAPVLITSEDSRIKTPAQERRRETTTGEGHIPGIRKYGAQKIPESRIVIERHPTVLETDVCPSQRNTSHQRRSAFRLTILSIGLPLIVGIGGTFLAGRYAPVAVFRGNQDIGLAKTEIVERPAPMNLTVSAPMASEVRTTSAARAVTGERVNEAQTPEPPRPIESVSSVPPESSTPRQSNSDAAITITSQEDASRSYPYAIYLGSYKNIDRAQKAVSTFREKGLSPYWVKVDLGEKGVWYRVLAGYFQTKDEVQGFIEEHQITEGSSRYVVYANLIGPYRSEEELNMKSLSLLELGYCPYVIKGVDGESLLFTGAFYHKTDAERERIELAAMGIQTRLVER